jgi:hypothetical protein
MHLNVCICCVAVQALVAILVLHRVTTRQLDVELHLGWPNVAVTMKIAQQVCRICGRDIFALCRPNSSIVRDASAGCDSHGTARECARGIAVGSLLEKLDLFCRFHAVYVLVRAEVLDIFGHQHLDPVTLDFREGCEFESYRDLRSQGEAFAGNHNVVV